MKNLKPQKKYLENESFLLENISKSKIIPVVKVDTEENAVKISNSLIEKKINLIEITYRTENAGKCIKKISNSFSNIVVGAGTITNIAQAKDAIKNGAKFLVMPGFDKNTVKYAIKNNIPIIPGVATPTEIMAAMNMGLHVLKLFPCNIVGGIDFLKSIKGPFPKIKFIPTGGINENNFNDYLSLENVIAVGGSWVVPPIE
jgi:2-dehydro-3-deoxyphosphogluconate aldolase/(4S)-4-hydroxy-2-oxoglutarate aldolase